MGRTKLKSPKRSRSESKSPVKKTRHSKSKNIEKPSKKDYDSNSEDEEILKIATAVSKRTKSKRNSPNSRVRSGKKKEHKDDDEEEKSDESDSSDFLKAKSTRTSGRARHQSPEAEQTERVDRPKRSKSSGKGDTQNNKENEHNKQSINVSDESDDEEADANEEEDDVKPKEKKKYEPDNTLYEVDKIVGHVDDHKRVRFFRIRWKGYDETSDTWERKDKLSCPKLIAQYYEENPDAAPYRRTERPIKKKPGRKKKIVVERAPKKLKIDQQSDYDSDLDENVEWEVGRILDVHVKRDGKREFLIRWKDYSKDSDSWEPEENLSCQDLIENFLSKLDNMKGAVPRELRQFRQKTQRFTLLDQASGRRLSKRNQGQQRVRYDDNEF